MNNKDILFKLIEHSLNNKKYQFESLDELELTKFIFENGLVGLVYHAIDPSSFKIPKYYQMLSQAFGSFVSKDVQQQAIITQVKDSFITNDIQHIFLKGTHLKALYPESYMRGMGDIDVIVKTEQFNLAKTLLIKMGFEFKSASKHHHVFESVDGNFIELHQSIISSNDYENETLLKAVWEHVYLDKDNTHKLKPEFEYVYLLTHLIRHIRTSGVGIRSILDMKIFSDAYKEVLDNRLLETYLNTYNLKTFNEKIIYLNQIFTNKIKPNGKDHEVIGYIMDSGIHGSGTKHDPFLTKRAHEQSRLKKSKFRYILSEIFPEKSRIIESYPYLKKRPWLLPWAWFVRGFKQVFKFKNTKKRLKSVSSDNKLDEVKDVFDYLGI